jgi:uncharacterized damage-inducible protein DinB
MADEKAHQYRRWFEYERDSHRRVLASLMTVPSDQHASAPFDKAVSLMAHIIAARQMWLFRFGVSQDPPPELFPTDVSLSGLAGWLETVERGWAGYLQNVTDQELRRTCEYQSLDAGRFRSVIEDILTQLFGHSLYHRGQIASLVKSAGGQPAITDFVYWSREPVSSP